MKSGATADDSDSDSNIASIAAEIYSVPAKDPCTNQLGLADCAPPNASETDKTSILFEILMELLLEGIKVKYGEALTPATLTGAQFEEISRYVASYGFILHVRSDHLTTAPPVSLEPLGADLKQYCERFYDFEREMWHEAYFDFYEVPLAAAVTGLATPAITKSTF